MTYRSYAPRNHGERASCIAAVARIASDGVVPALAKLIDTRYEPTLAAYEAARAANDAATVALARTVDDKAEADAAWALALQQWLASAYVLQGEKAVRAELKPLMQHKTPALFMRLAVRTRLDLMPKLDLFVRGLPELTGDLDLLDALRDATATLEEEATAWELAEVDRTGTSKGLVDAAETFDRCYGALVRAVRRFDPDGAGKLVPTFHRQTPAAEPAEIPDPAPLHADPVAAGRTGRDGSVRHTAEERRTGRSAARSVVLPSSVVDRSPLVEPVRIPEVGS